MVLWRCISCFYCDGGQTAIIIRPIYLVVGNRRGHFNSFEATSRLGLVPSSGHFII